MSCNRKISKFLVISTAIWVGISPTASANMGSFTEADVANFEGEINYENIPTGLGPGLSLLVTLLEDISAPDDIKGSAAEFLEFVKARPDIYQLDAKSLNNTELAEYKEALAKGAAALQALAPLSERLASSDWLQNSNKKLAEDIQRECGRRFVSGREMFKRSEEILNGSPASDAEIISLEDDLNSAVTECVENLKVYAASLAKEILDTKNKIDELTAKLEEARERDPNDPNIATLEEELQAAQEKLEDLDKDSDLLAVVKLLIGVTQIVAGVVGLVKSGGSCIPCAQKVVVGWAMTSDALDDLNDDPGTRPVIVPAQRKNIKPNETVSDAERNEVLNQIEKDPNFSYVKPVVPGGNYLVAKDTNTGNLIIVQIKPPAKISVDLSTVETMTVSENLFTSPTNLAGVDWTQVNEGFSVAPEAVRFQLEGKYGDRIVKVTFDQHPVDKPFVVTVETPGG